MFKKLKNWFAPLYRTLAIVGIAGAIVCTIAYIAFAAAGFPPVGSGLTMLVVYISMLVIASVVTHFIIEREGDEAEEDLPIGNISLDMLTKLEFPVLICNDEGTLIWRNRAFADISGSGSVSGKNISDLLPCDLESLLDGNSDHGEYEMFGGSYRVGAYSVTTKMRRYVMVVLEDVTALHEALCRLEDEDLRIAYVMIDNLDELTSFSQGDYRSASFKIASILEEWAQSSGGVIREYDKNKYVFIFHAKYLREFVEHKFDILDRVREVRVGDEAIPVTISIGTTELRGTPEEKSKAAMASLDMALQRGGDQAVVRTEAGLDYYGGVTKTTQKRTKVRARVIANELAAMIKKSSNVLVMGHARADFDSFGACIGICRLAMFLGVPVNAVVNTRDQNMYKCIKKAMRIPGYENVFIDANKAQDKLLSSTLLIIVDVNSPSQFESAELAENAHQTVFIDHHRKGEEFKENPLMAYIEPSASSACELISEILEQTLEPGMLTHEEADLMFAGIALDTKRFTLNSGTKTFSAAQYLRGEGADPMAVRQEFFTSPLDDMKREANFNTNTIIYRDVIAISVNTRSDTGEEDRIAAAKAADNLLLADGVRASFAMVRIGDDVRISARSNGTINVQIILERLSGGGHYDQAAALLGESTLEDALTRLKDSIDQYFSDNENT